MLEGLEFLYFLKKYLLANLFRSSFCEVVEVRMSRSEMNPRIIVIIMDNIAAEGFILKSGQFVSKTLQFFVLKTTNLIHMLKTAYFRNDPKYSNSIWNRDRTRRDEFSRRLEKWVKFCCLEKWPFLGHSRCLEKKPFV